MVILPTSSMLLTFAEEGASLSSDRHIAAEAQTAAGSVCLAQHALAAPDAALLLLLLESPAHCRWPGRVHIR